MCSTYLGDAAAAILHQNAHLTLAEVESVKSELNQGMLITDDSNIMLLAYNNKRIVMIINYCYVLLHSHIHKYWSDNL